MYQIKHRSSLLEWGWEREKHGPAEGNKEKLKVFFRVGEIQKDTKVKAVWVGGKRTG